MLGWSKRTRWITMGGGGSACAVGLALGVMALTAGASPGGQVTPPPPGPATSSTVPEWTAAITPASAARSAKPKAGTKSRPAVVPAPGTATSGAGGAKTSGGSVAPAPTPSVVHPVTTRVRSALATTSSTPSTTPSTRLATSRPATSPTTVPAAILQPPTAAVEQAIAGLAQYVRSPINPSVSEVNTLGDEVCTAFSQGATTSQIEAALVAKLGNIPFTTVLPGASTYVVDTAVSLYCPSYSSRLG